MSTFLSKYFRIICYEIGTAIASNAIESGLGHLQFTDYSFDLMSGLPFSLSHILYSGLSTEDLIYKY